MAQGTETDFYAWLVRIAGVLGAIWGICYTLPKIFKSFLGALDRTRIILNLDETRRQLLERFDRQDGEYKQHEAAKMTRLEAIENELKDVRIEQARLKGIADKLGLTELIDDGNHGHAPTRTAQRQDP